MIESTSKEGDAVAERPSKRGRRGASGRGASVETVLSVMRERIATHALLPGSRIQEVEMANEFKVSRTLVREVIGVLDQRGLVERIPNRGAVVSRLEPMEVFEIFEVREVLEGLCTRLATRRAPDGTWEPYIEVFGGSMKARIEAGEIEAYVETLEDLREAMIKWADNAHAQHFLGLVLDKARVIKRRVTVLPGRAETGRLMHLEMLKHMVARDEAAAEEAKRAIIHSARDWLERYRAFVF